MTLKLVLILVALVLDIAPSFHYASGVTLGEWEKKFEAEAADVYFGVETIDSNLTRYTGYTGKGYADFGGRESFVQWNNISLDETTDFDISIRYSSPNKRSCSLYVDKVKRGDYLIKSTGSWNTWGDSVPITVSLEKGIHQIKIVAIGSSGPNIDFLSIRIRGEITLIDYDEEIDEIVVEENNVSIVSEEIQDDEHEETLEPSPSPSKYSTSEPSPFPTKSPTLEPSTTPTKPPTRKPSPQPSLGPTKGEENEYTFSISDRLKEDTSLPRGKYISSPNGLYKIGLVNSTGELAIYFNSTNTITWSNGVLGGELIFMQSDGNLVVRNKDFKAIWNTESSGKNGAQLIIDNNGIASVVLDSVEIWTTREPFSISYNSGAKSLGDVNRNDNLQVDSNPNFKQFAEKVVLNSLEKLPRGKFVSSPSDKYQIGLNNEGNLVLIDLSNHTVIWSANVEGCTAATMQQDGNFVMRDSNNSLIWTTHTSRNPGARLVIDDGGRLAVMVGKTSIWMEGVPRGAYNGRPSSPSLRFPLRGIFYYPWYPETWSVNSKPAKFIPDLGKYSSDDSSVVEEHIDAMEYAYSDVAIASWWGPGTMQELSRISLLMDKSFEMKSSIKWTVYYEDEMFRNPSVEKIRSDLNYLKKWFIWHPAWLNIDNRPAIFVYNEAGCSINERWIEAAGDDWYVVLKVFPDRNNCKFQPDSYHQYGPSTPYIHIEGVSSSVSPGFWRADQEEAKLPRLSREKFCENTKNMVGSGEDWQLVTTFNEAGEGTLVEPSSDNWGSDTKYGYYLDCLHEFR